MQMTVVRAASGANLARAHRVLAAVRSRRALHDRVDLVWGSSTATLVALTAAITSIPGSRLSSSVASRLSSETNLCGPAWISTWAITVSRTTRVTRPLNLFRTDWATTIWSGA